MKNLKIKEILEAKDISIEGMFIPELDGMVYVRIMSGYERSELETFFAKMKGGAISDTGKFRKELLLRTMCNTDGEKILDSDTADKLMSKSGFAGVIEVIFEKSCELNGFRQRDVDTLKKK